jgi:transcriptional regulator with XRE-family HTH domain
MTQADLAKAVGVSRRVIAYYEHQDAQPPGAMLVDLAKALRVSADQLLGLKPSKDKTSPKTARLLKRLQKVERLPPTDQRVVLKLVDGLLERVRANGRG